MDKRWKIPDSWQWARLDQIATIVGGGTPSTRQEGGFSEPGIPWITPADLTGYGGTYIARGRRSLSDHGYATSSARMVPTGTVLFSSRAPIGYCVIAANPLSTSQGFKNLLLRGVSPEYVRYYLLGAREYAHSKASGTTFPELSGTRLGGLSIPVAPLGEQTRIVERIDAILGRVERARRDLVGVPALLACWRERVLEMAFSGQLTRTEGGEVASWGVRPLGDVITDIVAGKNLRCEERPPEPEESGVVKVSAVTWGRFDPAESKTLPTEFVPAPKTRIRTGDLLISRANTLQLVGAPVIVGEIPDNLYLSDKVLRLEVEPADRPWVMWFLRSPQGRAAIEARATGNQLSMRNLSQKGLLEIEAPWPAQSVRQEITKRIHAAFGRLDRAQKDHEAAVRLLSALEERVLDLAFRGALVPQQASEGTASALLADIERGSKAAPPRGGRPPRWPIWEEGNVDKDIEKVLAEADGWLDAQTAFQRSGIGSGAETEQIERTYARLRELDVAGRLEVDTVTDAAGRKLHDRLRLRAV